MWILNLSIQYILVGVVMASLMSLAYLSSRKRRGLPPGPVALPIIGNLHHLGADPRKSLRKLGEVHGDVFSIYFGPTLTVVLNSYEAIKEAFVHHGYAFNDRPYFFLQDIWDNKGIATVNGELWKEQKRFAVQAFNHIGRKKQVFQRSVEEEAEILVDEFLNRSGANSPIDVMDIVLPAICSVICRFLWSQRCDSHNPTHIKTLERMKENFELIGGTQILNIFPGLKRLPGDPFKYKKFIQNIKYDIRLNQDCIYQHRLSREANNPRDFVDAFLDAAETKQDSSNNYTDEQLHRVLLDIFGAGTQSSAATLVWAVLYMLHYPQVLSKVRKEIVDAVESRKQVTLEDVSKIPYTEATVLEIMRMADATPLGIPHATSQDIIFKGYHIPKGTTVMSNINAVCRDPNLWPNPDQFMPERFLSEKEGRTLLHKPDYFIPFSTGKRSCPGESLARMELVIFFANLMHNIDFAIPDGFPLPNLDGNLTTVYMPPDVKVIAHTRSHSAQPEL